MLGGSATKTFSKAEDYAEFASGAEMPAARLEPVAKKYGVKLAVENRQGLPHRRTDRPLEARRERVRRRVRGYRRTASRFSKDPLAYGRIAPPFALTVHLKDMGVEEASDGFRLARKFRSAKESSTSRRSAALRKANRKCGSSSK